MEQKFFKSGYKKILAIDEVGRGALAGPFYVGGILVNDKNYIKLEKIQLKDSKKLSSSKRKLIYRFLKSEGFQYKIIKFTNKEVDDLGIGNCFKEAIIELNEIFKPELILIDGRKLKINLKNAKFFVKGDNKIKSISAISIISKVLRDDYMAKIHKFYPEYNFKKNKGYGTKEHILAIKKFGLTKYHRESFCRNI